MTRRLNVWDSRRALAYAEDKKLRIGLADAPNETFYFYTASGQTVTKSATELKNWWKAQKENRA